ncbi:MAG: hypothetical protein P1S60_18805 [Anaerolineae bacterium]|nr:hypothetical protein [Anaerolineae bacterium]
MNNIFSVTRDNLTLDYEGLMVMRGDPLAEDYILLAAGESVSKEVNLAKFYDFSTAGDYTIAFNSPVFTHVAEREEDLATTLDELESIAIPSHPVTISIPSPNLATEAVPEPENTEVYERYTNTDFGFTFRYPDTWTLDQESDQLVTLAKGNLRLSIGFSQEGGGEEPWWSGLPAGDLQQEEAITFMGESMEKLALIYNDKVTTVIYDCLVSDIVFVIRLDDVVTADYEAIDITDVEQQEVDDILSSFTLLTSAPGNNSMQVEGTVQHASASARSITLAEPVDGIQTIALTEDCELTWDDSSPINLNEILPGMSVHATGHTGSSGTLLADIITIPIE